MIPTEYPIFVPEKVPRVKNQNQSSRYYVKFKKKKKNYKGNSKVK